MSKYKLIILTALILIGATIVISVGMLMFMYILFNYFEYIASTFVVILFTALLIKIWLITYEGVKEKWDNENNNL